MPHIPKIIVVANRWDGFGARMTAIVNAMSIAKALGLAFRFTWPHVEEWGLSNHKKLFNTDFFNHHTISNSDWADRDVLFDPSKVTLAEAKRFCENSTGKAVILIDECFNILSFAGEKTETAESRFRAAFSEIGWGESAKKLIAVISEDNFPQNYLALHVRAGDIVTGRWRQFLPVEKYVPTQLVDFAIELHTNADNRSIVLLSDNEIYAQYLQSRYIKVLLARDVFIGYERLDVILQTFADQLLLSRASLIQGPRASAFSHFGANLGNLKISGPMDGISKDEVRSLLVKGIAKLEHKAGKLRTLDRLAARDICWFQDVFFDELTETERVKLTQRAVDFDHEYCGARNRHRLNLALAGTEKSSSETFIKTMNIVKSIRTHRDPLCEVLATSISCKALTDTGRYQDTALYQKSTSRYSLEKFLERLRRSRFAFSTNAIKLYLCKKLGPYQIHWGPVIQNLTFQLHAANRLRGMDSITCSCDSEEFKNSKNKLLDLRSWRISGFNLFNKPGSFPQVLRNTEVVSIRLAHLLASRLSLMPASIGYEITIDEFRTSPAGLTWAYGWSFAPENGVCPTAVGFYDDDELISASPIYLSRPDVAEAFNNQDAQFCGFSIPVPLAHCGTREELLGRLRVY